VHGGLSGLAQTGDGSPWVSRPTASVTKLV